VGPLTVLRRCLSLWAPIRFGSLAEVVELVDALRSGRSGRKPVGVRVPPSASFPKAERRRRSTVCAASSFREAIAGFGRQRRGVGVPDPGCIADGGTFSGNVAVPKARRSASFATSRYRETSAPAWSISGRVGVARPAADSSAFPSRVPVGSGDERAVNACPSARSLALNCCSAVRRMPAAMLRSFDQLSPISRATADAVRSSSASRSADRRPVARLA
jgi:hypothetical protein